MGRLTSRGALLLLLAAFPVLGCDVSVGENGFSVDLAKGKATDEWVRSYPLAPGGRLEIVNSNGQIDAAPATGSQVEVRVERSARAGSDEEARTLLQAIQMDEDVAPQRVRVAIRREQSARGLRRFASRNGVTLRYHVRLPAGVDASFETVNGGIRLVDLSGRVSAATTNGGVTGERLSGGITATSVNGGIRLQMAQVTSDIQVSITNGGVRLELPADVKATIDASCVNGGISIDDDLRMQATDTSRRHVGGTLNGGGPKIVASTVNGGVRISSRESARTD